ncbi:MAG TPA: hypothetical protein VMZ31_19940 [Phycisphaerae bacterium]|nr:hypothetical protein [Phycisphaerae bacterium]
MKTGRNLWPLLFALMAMPACKPGEDVEARKAESIDTEDRIRTKGEPPTFSFAPEATCEDTAVNGFVKRFVQTCLNGDYAGYREMVTRLVEPIGREAFETAWHAVERVEVNSIVLTEGVQRYPAPVYLVGAEVEMREPEASDAHVVAGPRVRNVNILVFQEAGEWVMAPAPREIRQRYAASRPADDTPAPTR